MYIDLNYRTSRKLPAACDFVAGLSGTMLGDALLLWNKARNEYESLSLSGVRQHLDKQEVIEALMASYGRQDARSIGPIVPAAPEPRMRLRSVSIDDKTANTLRGYGAGNLSEGIRRAARLIETG